MSVEMVSVHDFLYGDRHSKFYPDIKIYLGGTLDRLIPFLSLLHQGKSAKEICETLKLTYRGDIWFATLLVYFHVRDGLVEHPTLMDVKVPPELAANLEEYEHVWQHRHDPRPGTSIH